MSHIWQVLITGEILLILQLPILLEQPIWACFYCSGIHVQYIYVFVVIYQLLEDFISAHFLFQGFLVYPCLGNSTEYLIFASYVLIFSW
jgi:hypothetical protein